MSLVRLNLLDKDKKASIKKKEALRISNLASCKKWREANPENHKNWAFNNREHLNNYSNEWAKENAQSIVQTHQDRRFLRSIYMRARGVK